MIARVLTAIVVSTVTASSAAAIPDPCKLLTAAEIRSALGSAPGPGKVTGPIVDKESQATNSVCSMDIGEEMLIVSVAEFATAAAAQKAFAEIAEGGDFGVPQPGLGERALWEAKPDAVWTTIKGKYLLNVMVSTVAGDGTRHREPLKRLAVLALAKL